MDRIDSLELLHDELAGSVHIQVAKDRIEFVSSPHVNVINVQWLQWGRLEALSQVADRQRASQFIHRSDDAFLWAR